MVGIKSKIFDQYDGVSETIQERERVLFSTTELKRKTMITIAWKVARKANQPIKAGDPLSYTPVTNSKTLFCHFPKNKVLTTV